MEICAHSGLVPRRLSLRLAAVMAATTLSASVDAQEPTQQVAPDSATAPDSLAGPQPIAFVDVPSRAEATSAEIRSLSRNLDEDPELIRIGRDLPDRVAELDRELQELQDRDLSRLSLRMLTDVRFDWLRRRAQVSEWQQSLESRWRSVNEDRDRVRELRQSWEATETTILDSDDAPDGLAGQAATTLDEIGIVRVRLRERSESIFALQERVADLQTRINTALDEIDTSESAARSALFTRTQGPLWQLVRTPDAPEVAETTREAWSNAFRTVGRYLGENTGRLYLIGFIFLIILGALFSLYRRISHWVPDPEENPVVARVLSRPISAAVVLTLILSFWLLPLMPAILGELVLVAILIPVLRLSPGYSGGAFRPYLYGLAAIFMVNQLVSPVPEGTIVRRLLIVLVTVLGLAGAISLVLRVRRVERPDSGWWKAGLLGWSVAAVILAVSLIANVLGWARLSELLTDATILSAYSGVVLAVAAIALKALFDVFPDTAAGRSLHSVSRHATLFRRRSVRLIELAALLIWAQFSMSAFGIWNVTLAWLTSLMEQTAEFGGLTLSLGHVFAVLVIVAVTILISRIVRFVLGEEILPRLRLKRGQANAIVTLTNWVIIAIGIVAAAGAAGLEGGQMTVVVGALGVGIGFGLQNVVNNFVSGLILIFEQPIKVGDRIEVGTLFGEVRKIGIRSSVVRTFEGAEIVVPNGNLVSEQLVNWTLSDQRRRGEVQVGVKYGTDPDLVLSILRDTAASHPMVLGSPEPDALFIGFGDSSLDFKVRFWTDFDAMIDARSQITGAINNALKEAGIEIPFPQRDLHLRSADQEVVLRTARAADGSEGPGDGGLLEPDESRRATPVDAASDDEGPAAPPGTAPAPMTREELMRARAEKAGG